MKRISIVAAVTLAAALLIVTSASALVNNGGFETGTFGGWVQSTFINNGFSAATSAGGTNLSAIVGGPAVSPLTLSDPNTNGALKFPGYGSYTARVNSEASYNTPGNGKNGNKITQNVAAFLDPADGLAHVRFTYAAVMVNPVDSPHTSEEKPYFRVRAVNTSNGNDVLYDFASYVSEPGKNWKNGAVFTGSDTWQYLDWNYIDLRSGPAHPVNAGDVITLEVSAAGCSKGGHPGYVYVDEITDGEIAGPTIMATGPASVGPGGQITYTYNYKNGSSVTVDPTVTTVQPAGVTFNSVSDTANCSLASGAVTCNLSNVAPGTAGSFTVTGTVTAPNGTQLAHGNYQIAAAGFPTLSGQTVLSDVNIVNTVTTVSASSNPAVYGQPVTFTANVETVPSGQGSPTGTVQFVIDGANFGAPVPVSGGSAQISTSSLSVGGTPHTVTAQYSGSSTFAASSGSLAGGESVDKDNSTVSVSAGPNPAVYGQGVNLTAVVSAAAPGSGAPTGNVSFYVDGVLVCSNVALSASQGNCSVSNLGPGDHTVVVTYSGDLNFNSGSGGLGGTGLVVNPSGSTTSMTVSPASSVSGQNVTFSATVTALAPGNGTPTGTVSFTSDGNTLCTVAVILGQAGCSVSDLGVGTHNVVASFSGDANFTASSTNAPFTVGKADSSVGVTASPDPAVFGQPSTITATVTATGPGSGVPTGTASFFADGSPICTGVALSSAVATCTVADLAPGTHTITVTYGGDGTFNNSGGTLAGGILVNKADSSVSVGASVDPSVFGQTVTFSALVAAVAPGSGMPTGTVTFFADGNAVCANAALSSGQAVCETSGLSVGNHNISVTFAGDPNFNASSGSLASAMIVNKADSAIAIDATPNPALFGQATVFTAAVTASAPGSGTPTGTVTFLSDGGPICQSLALTNGVASCSVSNIATGTHTITAVYAGDNNFNNSGGTLAGGFAVSKADSSLTLTASAAVVVSGQPVTFTTQLSAVSPGAGTPTGTVTFLSDGSPICSNVQVQSGTAVCTVSNLPTGSHTITGAYGGDENFNGSNGALAAPLSVNKSDTTVHETSSPSTSVFGQSVTFTANVTPVAPGAGTPTGTISFNVDGWILCPNVQMVNATASCTVDSLFAGDRQVAALYNGDANFNTSAAYEASGPHHVNKADTTITIDNGAELGTPTIVGQPYTVKWSYSVVAPGAGTPTGEVTVSDGSSTCSAPVAAGSCDLASESSGAKAISAAYAGDSNFFNGSVSSPVSHNVLVRISGTVTDSGAVGLSGVSVSIAGANGGTVMTDASGTFAYDGMLSGDYVITPSIAGKWFDPVSRNLVNVTANVSGISFVGYDGPGVPRDVRVVTSYAVPGRPVDVSLKLTSLGNERAVNFALSYDVDPMGTADVTCGSDAPNCTLSVDRSVSGKLGITVVGASQFTAGDREIAKIRFQTFPTSVWNSPLTFGSTPIAESITDAGSNPLASTFTDGMVVFAQGWESDTANRATGEGMLLANDVTMARQFVVGLIKPNASFNEFQRVDSAPAATMGDGVLDATDVIQARLYVLGSDEKHWVGGPFTPAAQLFAPAARSEASGGRELVVPAASGTAGGEVTVQVMLHAKGDEAASSFSLNYDPTKLSNPRVSLGSGVPADAELTVNTEEADKGQIAVLIDSSTAFASAEDHLVTVTFDIPANAIGGETEIAFGNLPSASSVSDARGNRLAANYQSGIVTISSANSAGYEVSGRVLTPDGGGLRNAQITITGADGLSRTAVTSSLGFYRFDSVRAGERLTISVNSKRFRFASKTVTMTGNLTDLDLTGIE